MTDLLQELFHVTPEPAGEELRDELKVILSRMSKLREQFYWTAFHADLGTSCHAFLEFFGLMGEFVQMCHRSAEKGIDFRHANKHGGAPLHMEDYQAKYLAEKFDCIFGPSLRANPAAARAFIRGLHLEEVLKPENP